MNKRPSFKEYKEEILKDEAFRAGYETLNLEFELIRQFFN